MNIKIFQSDTKFKFGDRKQVSAVKRVIFPTKIAGKICQIEAEIVKENIALLLSKNSLKRCGTVIDTNNNKATIFNKKIDLHFSSSGHYCINIVPEFKTTGMCEKVLVLESELSSKSKFNQLKKDSCTIWTCFKR